MRFLSYALFVFTTSSDKEKKVNPWKGFGFVLLTDFKIVNIEYVNPDLEPIKSGQTLLLKSAINLRRLKDENPTVCLYKSNIYDVFFGDTGPSIIRFFTSSGGFLVYLRSFNTNRFLEVEKITTLKGEDIFWNHSIINRDSHKQNGIVVGKSEEDKENLYDLLRFYEADNGFKYNGKEIQQYLFFLVKRLEELFTQKCYYFMNHQENYFLLNETFITFLEKLDHSLCVDLKETSEKSILEEYSLFSKSIEEFISTQIKELDDWFRNTWSGNITQEVANSRLELAYRYEKLVSVKTKFMQVKNSLPEEIRKYKVNLEESFRTSLQKKSILQKMHSKKKFKGT